MANEVTITSGDTVPLTFTIVDDDNNAYDLTGFTMTMTIKKNKADTTNSYQGTATISTPSSGIGTLTISASDSVLTPGISYYDVQIDDGTNVYTPIISSFSVGQGITTGVFG